MPNRVTFTQINTSVQSNIATNYRKLDELQRQLSSGKRISRPSDAPVDITSALELRSRIRELQQFQRNIDDGLAYLSFVDTTLVSNTNLLQAAREKAIQGSNDTYTADERRFIHSETKVLLEQMVSLANSSFKGKFLFSGSNTQTPPYEIRQGREYIDDVNNTGTNPDDTFLNPGNIGTPIRIFDRSADDSTTNTGNPRAYHLIPGTLQVAGLNEGTDYEVDYINGTITFLPPGTQALAQAATIGAPGVPNGIELKYEWIRESEKDLEGAIEREIEAGVPTRLNLTAKEAFGERGPGANQWGAMITLLEGLHENDSGKVRSSIGKVDQAVGRLLSSAATNGSRVNRFEATSQRGESRIIDSTHLQSKLEDLDFAKAISEFTLQQSVYQASLQAGARTIQQTLADFL